MKKIAGMEETEVKDPATGKRIAVSTTVRLVFRETWPHEFKGMRNTKLNDVIAKDFARNSSNIKHYFRLGTGSEKGTGHRGVAEIRKGGSSFYYISAIRSEYVEILTIQASWLEPKYKGSSDNPIALGDE